MTVEAHHKQAPCMTPVPSALGEFTVVWRETPAGPTVCRILLPGEQSSTERAGQATGGGPASSPAIRQVAEQIQHFLEGEAVDFRTSLLDLGECSGFQRRVLLAQHKVPRGWVSTYGGIARSLSLPQAARAVGTALARNPFPIIIPCHRTIRSTGDLGGFGGGLKMKQALLELEGVEFSASGKVLSKRFYY